jgi:hypothetical protein
LLNRPFPRACRALLINSLVVLVVMVGGFGLTVPRAMAAEILSIRGATLLRVGDQNRSTTVELACVSVSEADSAEAVAWLRRRSPRGTKVNLRPVSQRDGLLVANVRVLKSGLDLGDGLVAEGLATALPCRDQPSPT